VIREDPFRTGQLTGVGNVVRLGSRELAVDAAHFLVHAIAVGACGARQLYCFTLAAFPWEGSQATFVVLGPVKQSLTRTSMAFATTGERSSMLRDSRGSFSGRTLSYCNHHIESYP
jgi:hypothetical protein